MADLTTGRSDERAIQVQGAEGAYVVWVSADHLAALKTDCERKLQAERVE